MADEVQKSSLEKLGEAKANAISSADLMQGLMAQIYDIFTTGGEVANPSEDNFFCWLTPGIAVSPDQFEFATEGLSGVIRAKTPSARASSAKTSQDATDNLVNQIIKKRVEQIANQKLEVVDIDANTSAEEKRKRAKELEAQKAKEKKQQDQGTAGSVLSKVLESAIEEDSVSEPMNADLPMDEAPLPAEDPADKIVFKDIETEADDDDSILNKETMDLSEPELEVLKAERTTLLYMQAENFSQLVNFIPDVSGRQEPEKGAQRGLNVLENEGALYDVYSMVLKQSQVMKVELDKKTLANIEKCRSMLESTKEVKKDIFSDETETIVVDSPLVEAYNEKMTAYNDAVLEYNTKHLAALAQDNAAAVHDWALNAKIYYNKVRQAMNAWVTKGYKNEYDQISAFIDNVMQKDMSLLKRQYQETLERSMMTGLVSGTEFPFTTLSPANFANSSGWTSFTFNQRSYKDHIKSDVNNNSLKIDQTSTSWFHKQHYNYAKDKLFQDLDMDFDMNKLEISFKICQVNIVRPWFKPSFLVSRYWRFDPGTQQGMEGMVLSSGGYRPEGILPAYPSSMLLVKDVVLDFHDTAIATAIKHQYERASHDGGLGLSIGVFGIGATANVSYLDNKKNDDSSNRIKQNNTKIEIPGMQIIGYRCHILGKSPNPNPDIKDWA